MAEWSWRAGLKGWRAAGMAAGLAVVATLGAGRAEAGTRWAQFRGENAQGVADEEKPPVQFNASTNLLWKTPLPKGHSSPCIWDDRIFLTGYAKGKLETLCIGRQDGKILWRMAAPAQKIERVNGMNSPATPTPVCDGQRVYVLFGSFGLIAYDMDGREAWRKPLPFENVRHGTATSPILAGGRLIVNGDQEDMKSFLIALDPADGKTLWQIPRPMCFSSHTTPLYLKRDGAEEVLIAGSIRLVAYDLKDGSERWSSRGLEAISICPTPAMGDGMIFPMSQSMGEDKLPTFESLLAQADKNHDGKIAMNEGTSKAVRDTFSIIDTNHDGFLTRDEWDAAFRIFKLADTGLFALRPGTSGDASTNVFWRQKQGMPETVSPLYYRGRVFVIKSGGLASCFDARSGKALYQSQRVGAAGNYFASPVAADGRIYVASTQGTVSVIDAGDTLKVLERNQLEEAIVATPAIVDNRIYIRTAEHLWAFGGR